MLRIRICSTSRLVFILTLRNAAALPTYLLHSLCIRMFCKIVVQCWCLFSKFVVEAIMAFGDFGSLHKMFLQINDVIQNETKQI